MVKLPLIVPAVLCLEPFQRLTQTLVHRVSSLVSNFAAKLDPQLPNLDTKSTKNEFKVVVFHVSHIYLPSPVPSTLLNKNHVALDSVPRLIVVAVTIDPDDRQFP